MPASPGVNCGFGLSCWLAKSLLCVCALWHACVFVFSAPVFLNNLAVFSLSVEKCWRSESQVEWVRKKRGDVKSTSKLLFVLAQTSSVHNLQSHVDVCNDYLSYDSTEIRKKITLKFNLVPSTCTFHFRYKSAPVLEHTHTVPWATGREGSPCLIFSLPVKCAEGARTDDMQV